MKETRKLELGARPRLLHPARLLALLACLMLVSYHVVLFLSLLLPLLILVFLLLLLVGFTLLVLLLY